MTYRLLTSLVKILIASLLVGVALSYLKITPEQILRDVGMTPEQVLHYLERGIRWALPHVLLGALIIVPIWLVIFLLRPPSGE